jgi:hypothetical protein
MLPKDIFGDIPTTSSLNFSKSRVTQEPQVSANWDHLLTTERNYVRDLENLHVSRFIPRISLAGLTIVS